MSQSGAYGGERMKEETEIINNIFYLLNNLPRVGHLTAAAWLGVFLGNA